MWTNPRRWVSRPLVNFYDRCRFEFAGIWGRFWMKRRYRFPDRIYLNLGSGCERLPGFVNVDYFYFRKHVDLALDLRYALPFDDGVWQGIFCHHVFEHVPHDAALRLLDECHRTLRTGGTLRIVVPDAGRALRLYASTNPSERVGIYQLYERTYGAPKFRTPLEVVNYLTYGTDFNPHAYAWDFETLELVLKAAGFRHVQLSSLNASADPLLNHDQPDWAEHSVYVDAIK
jgi:SAM-dependent methyltransferase